MYRLNNRYGKLLGFLFSQNKLITLEEIAKGVGISKTTVWRDLTFLESILPDEWKIEKDKFSGVYLGKPQGGTLEKLWSEVRKHCAYFKTLSFILLNKGVELSKISENFHISRSTVYRHLEVIQQVVRSAGIELTSSPYKIVGDEKRIRAFYMQFWELVDDDMRSKIDTHESIETVEFQKNLKRFLLEHSMVLHPGAFQRLIVALKISNMRMAQNNYVSFSMKSVADLKESDYFKVAKKLFQYRYLEQCPNQDNQLQEIFYLALYLMSEEDTSQQSSLTHQRGFYDFRNKMKQNEEYLLFSLSKEFSDYVGFDLAYDDIFLSNLLQLGKKISIAKQFEIDTASSGVVQYLQYVEEQPLFQYVEEVLVVKCAEILGGEVKKEYILNVFFLLQAAVLRKRSKHSLRIALIGATFVEMDYIYEVLNSYLGNRVVISPLDDVTFEIINHQKQFELIIATDLVNASHVRHIPIMKISSFPTKSELIKIENFIENHFSDVLGLDKELVCTFSTSVSL